MTSSVRGIDHIGITVPDIEKATQFFERAFGAQVLYHSVDAETDNIDQPAQQHTLKLFPGTKIHAILHACYAARTRHRTFRNAWP